VSNPFRSEAEAYRFVWLTIGYFALIVAASFVWKWLGLAVFVVLSVGLLGWMAKRRREKPIPTVMQHHGRPDVHRILVIANETVGGVRLREAIEHAATDKRTELMVVCPALNSPLRHWASDEDPARAQAQARLDSSLERLRRLGIDASGQVGDAEPLQAIDDALRTFRPDELIISTHPPGRSHWLEKGIVEGARERFRLPITHVVVDLEAEREEIRN
jgi:nucleotide-binding universal stress UspA family protein